ncbi:MAG: phage head morphogenesis protein, partial [Helicobacteraceae bacterium]|nr:phage head morphogenesis protein [Helicobacteraceae bacterium]
MGLKLGDLGAQPLGYNEIGDALRARFTSLANAEPAKLQSAGFTLARQNINIAHVTRMIENGVPYARVQAEMDVKTTPICRSLHGRLIPMAHLKAQLDK